MNILTAKWPFYVSGPLLALLLAGSLCLFGDPVGLTAAMTAMTEYCDSAVAGQSLPDAPAMDWQLAMLFGLFFGALIAAASGGNFKLEFFDGESGSFTVKTLRTILGGVAGGFLVMLGLGTVGLRDPALQRGVDLSGRHGIDRFNAGDPAGTARRVRRRENSRPCQRRKTEEEIMAPIELSGNWKLAAAVLVGLALGFTLVKSDLIWQKTVRSALQLRNGRIIKSVLLALALGVVFVFLASRAGLLPKALVHPAFLWSALLGGALTGAGLVISSLTPTTAVASLAAGRLRAVWVLLGMALAIPAVKSVSGFLSDTLYRWDMALDRPALPDAFFSAANPGLYLTAVLLALLLLVHFTIGDPEE